MRDIRAPGADIRAAMTTGVRCARHCESWMDRVLRHAEVRTGDDMPVSRLAWTTVTPCEKQGRARRDPRLE